MLDSLTMADICALYTRRDIHPNRKTPIAYRMDKFIHHLKVRHGMSIIDYCEKHLHVDWPVCPVRGRKVGHRVTGKGLWLSVYAQGAIDTSQPCRRAQYAKFKVERKGAGNPMYGRQGWNKGLTEVDPRVACMKEQRRRFIAAEDPKVRSQRSKDTYEKHNLRERFHHRMPHSEETKQKARVNTARLWAEGVFNRTSSLHLAMRAFLNTLPLKQPFTEEHQVKWFSMDFAFPDIKVAIECQGGFFHIDPRLYPNGPENAIQRRNWGRDIAKRKVCCDQEGWVIIEAWEIEINNGQFKEDIICKLNQYGLLDS